MLINVPVANQASMQLQETSNAVVKIFYNAQFVQTWPFVKSVTTIMKQLNTVIVVLVI